MAFFKTCCCPGPCRNDADVSDIAPEDQATAVVCCQACVDADCDPFEETDECRAQAKEIPACPTCEGPGRLLGALGNVTHYRCRDCGIDYNNFGDHE